MNSSSCMQECSSLHATNTIPLVSSRFVSTGSSLIDAHFCLSSSISSRMPRNAFHFGASSKTSWSNRPPSEASLLSLFSFDFLFFPVTALLCPLGLPTCDLVKR
uniref:Uncharacterized protein n=1 Tax=Opuntia streptacantha TaxID=393608 RepID=A0A7C9ARS3_OPUST